MLLELVKGTSPTQFGTFTLVLGGFREVEWDHLRTDILKNQISSFFISKPEKFQRIVHDFLTGVNLTRSSRRLNNYPHNHTSRNVLKFERWEFLPLHKHVFGVYYQENEFAGRPIYCRTSLTQTSRSELRRRLNLRQVKTKNFIQNNYLSFLKKVLS